MFGEFVDRKVLNRAMDFALKADVLIIVGTTMQFAYLANLVARAAEAGAVLVYIDPQASPYKQAFLVLDQDLEIERKLICIQKPSDEVMPELSRILTTVDSREETAQWACSASNRR
jgi:NAD-dependent deacetylase